VAVIAALTGALLIVSARGLGYLWLYVHRKVELVVPRRVSFVLSTLGVALLIFVLVNDVFARLALTVADAMFLQLDNAVEDGIERPDHPLATGSEQSLVAWDSIGRRGKDFIAAGPTQQAISQFWDKETVRPLRIYVGLGSEETPQERAKLALEELKRVGGFRRSVLVVATPTGTGWLDPGAVDTLEFLHAGDTAIVSMQYSYLPSWLTILVDPSRSRHAASVLFEEIYGYWKTLPKRDRPRLYLHGLSLGSLGSEASADLFTVFDDPIQGAVWSGPPFPSRVWARVTRYRNPNSPMWLPRFRDGSMVRFTGQVNSLDKAGKRWGSMRFVYIQHASDPMTFFAPELLYEKPGWLIGKRGPDVSPYLKWFPVVTFLQIGFDLPMATSVPTGYGHNYSPASYIDAWIAVTAPEGWSNEHTNRLKQLFADSAGLKLSSRSPAERDDAA
jgi:uncharacterized membrane protein